MKRVYAALEIAFWNKAIPFLAESRMAQGLVRKAYPVIKNKKRDLRLVLALILVAASLGAGYFVTARLAAGTGEAQNEALVNSLVLPESPITSLPNGQRSLLLVSADDLSASRPQLDGAWLILFIPPEPRLTLLPIYPSLQTDDGAFSTAFGISKEGEIDKLNPDFLRLLRARDIWWSSYVVIDRASQAAVLAYLESTFVSTGGLPQTGENPKQDLIQQATILQEICWRAGRYGTPDQGSVPDLKGHVVVDPLHGDALADLAGLSIPSGGFSCEFPTLTFQAYSGQ